MKKLFTFLLFFLLVTPNATCQDEDGQDKYNTLFTWGINKNTSGGIIGGLVLKYSYRLRERIFRTYALEIMNVTHSQESRIKSRSGYFFIYGKSNYLYVLRPQYGYDFLFFRKGNRQGIEIKGVTAAGISIGIVSPYYIERILTQKSFLESTHEQYDPTNPEHSYYNIVGPGYFLEGLGQSKIQVGGNIKAGLNFEFGATKKSIVGFEIGFLLDAYFDKVVLIPTAHNTGLFPTFYGTLFYGSRR